MNHPICLGCHGDGDVPHLLWGNYGNWNGNYGSRDLRKKRPENEIANCEKLFETTFKESPYKKLDTKFGPIDFNQFEANGGDLNLRPNTHIGFLASHINARVFATHLEKNLSESDFNKFIYENFCKKPLIDTRELLAILGFKNLVFPFKDGHGNFDELLLAQLLSRVKMNSWQSKQFNKSIHYFQGLKGRVGNGEYGIIASPYYEYFDSLGGYVDYSREFCRFLN